MHNKFRSTVCALLLLIALSSCFLLSSCSSNYWRQSKQVMDHLTVAASLAKNGDMTVTEKWKVSLEDRGRPYRNLYRSFPVPNAKVNDVTGLSVHDDDLNRGYTFAGDIDPEETSENEFQEQCYLHRTSDSVEIGWFMPAMQEGTKNFTITYTVKNAVSVYRDTAVLYNAFLPENFSLPVTKMDGSIKFPQGAKKDQVFAWLHTTANSNLTIVSGQQVDFTASEIPADTLVEVRMTAPTALFSSSKNRTDQIVLQKIKQEENQWAEDYKNKLRQQFILGIADAAGGLIFVLGSILLLIYAKRKYRRHKVEAPEYTREIPQGNSPAGVANLFYFYGSMGQKEKNRVLSATLLSLARKGYVGFSNESKEIIINILGDTKQVQLTGSESAFYKILNTVGEANGQSFTLGQFRSYAEEHCKYIDSSMDSFFWEAKKEIADRGYFEKRPGFLNVLKTTGFLSFVLAIAAFLASAQNHTLFVYTPLGLLIAGVFLLIGGSLKMRLSEKGEMDYGVWFGLKKYMLEFSRMKEYGVPQLKLWEEYLVYATMMGISGEVCKQLKLVYPELSGGQNPGDIFAGSYMYYMFWPGFHMGGLHPAGFDFGSALGNTIGDIGAAATRLTNMPTGSGHDGGFGGFGGFGGGGFGGGGFGGGGGGFGAGGGGGVR